MYWIKDHLKELGVLNNIVGLLGIGFLLLAALFVQFFMEEQPCPLCLLQRAAFVNIGICLILNLRFGNRSSHWATAILSACAGIAVSMRQILLHVNDPIGFGGTFLGLHMYSWCFIGFSLVIIGSAFVLLIFPIDRKIF